MPLWRRSCVVKSLITGHLEKISSKVFEDYHPEITHLVGKNHGVYALYKNDRLYYVGLAKNLRSRVKHHLKDRHSNKWDTFSIYLIHHAGHLREIEALILHIAEPRGNKQRGKLLRSKNYVKSLRIAMIESNKRAVENILGKRTDRKKRKKALVKRKHQGALTMLPIGTKIFSKYKGVEYEATIVQDGKIKFQNELFASPSMAGHLLTKRATNGWYMWKYYDQNGKLVLLNTLRK